MNWKIGGPGRYRKTATVEAMQISADGLRNENQVSQNSLSLAAISGWMRANGFRDFEAYEVFVDDVLLYGFRLKTLEGWMEAKPGCWILRGSEGEFWPVQESIFAKTYAMVEDD